MMKHDSLESIKRYCHNHGLFSTDYFESVLRDRTRFPKLWQRPAEVRKILEEAVKLWAENRAYFTEYDAKSPLIGRFVGLPPGLQPSARSESDIEQKFIGKVVTDLFCYGFVHNTTLELQGEAAEEAKHEGTTNKRPDM